MTDDAQPTMTAAEVPAPQPWRKWTVGERFATATVIVLIVASLGFGFFWFATTSWGRVASASNLRQLGLALQMYANTHGGRLPVDWAELLLDKEIELTPEILVSPFSADDEARHTLSKVTQAKLVATPGSLCCTYVSTAAGMAYDDLPDDAVLAFEPAEVNGGVGTNLLFKDARVDWVWLPKGSLDRDHYRDLLAGFGAGVRPLRFSAAP